MREQSVRYSSRIGVRIVAVLALAFMLVIGLFSSSSTAYAAKSASSGPKAIAVVYDDSGSMFMGKGGVRWCQGKYGLETLAGMVSAQDDMRVFPLNSAVFDVSAASSQERARLVHDTPIYDYHEVDTPGGRVRESLDWLRTESAPGGKYMVIVTDGEFNSAADDAAAAVAEAMNEGIHVIFIRINENSVSRGGFLANMDESSLLVKYNVDETDSGAILRSMIGVSQIIFERHELASSNYNQGASKLTLPVSTTKLIVFAQGYDASIGSLEGTTKTNGESARFLL